MNWLHGTATALSSAMLLSLGTPAMAAELVTNGDFQAGLTGFQSTFNADGSGAGRITITTNPSNNGPFDSYGDHTTGTGNMLLVDPNQGGATHFWQQTFGVVANSTYTLSYWARQAGGGPLAVIDARVNGVSVGQSTPPRGAFQQFTTNYSSGSSTSVTFSLFDLNTTNFFNDFTIDDISFVGEAPVSPVPEPATWGMMLVGFGAVGAMLRRRQRTGVRFA